MCQQDSQFLTKREGEKGEGTVTSYEACRIRFHAVSFLVIGMDGVVVHQGREFNRTRWNIILSNFAGRSNAPSKWDCARVCVRVCALKRKKKKNVRFNSHIHVKINQYIERE